MEIDDFENIPTVTILPPNTHEWDRVISNNQLWVFINGRWKVLIGDVKRYLEKIKERE